MASVYCILAFGALVIGVTVGLLIYFDHYLEMRREAVIYKHIRKGTEWWINRTEEMVINVTDKTMEKAIQKSSELTRNMFSDND